MPNEYYTTSIPFEFNSLYYDMSKNAMSPLYIKDDIKEDTKTERINGVIEIEYNLTFKLSL